MAEPFRIKIDLPNATGVLGDPNGYLIANEAQLRVAQRNVGVGYITLVQARVFNDTTWTTLATLTGDVLSSAIDISAYDLLRFNVNTAGSTGDLYISSFFPKALSAGGGGNSFETIQTDAGTNPVASSSSDTLTLTSSDGSITITGNSGTDTIDLIANGSGGGAGTIEVTKNSGAIISTRPQLNFIEGDGISLNIVDDVGNDQVDITITSESELKYAKQVDDVSGTTLYIGEAIAGTALSAASWRISKVVFTGDDVSVTWSDGDTNFNNIWDNRLSLTYS